MENEELMDKLHKYINNVICGGEFGGYITDNDIKFNDVYDIIDNDIKFNDICDELREFEIEYIYMLEFNK